jgi:hypothetical protein
MFRLLDAGGRPGDMDMDGHVDARDIDPFVLGLNDPAAYAKAFTVPATLHGDIDADGDFDFDDIGAFVELLTAARAGDTSAAAPPQTDKRDAVPASVTESAEDRAAVLALAAVVADPDPMIPAPNATGSLPGSAPADAAGGGHLDPRRQSADMAARHLTRSRVAPRPRVATRDRYRWRADHDSDRPNDASIRADRSTDVVLDRGDRFELPG